MKTTTSSMLPLLGLLLLLLSPVAHAFTFHSFFGSSSSATTAPPAPLKAVAGVATTEETVSSKRSAALMVPPPPPSSPATCTSDVATKSKGASPLFYLARFAMALAPSSLVMVGAGTLTPALFAPVEAVHAAAAAPAAGADEVGTDTDFKIKRGSASTLNQGIVKTMTRGVNIDKANFEGKDLTGVSFQQSLMRAGNFRNSKCVSASFFDGDLSNADFTGANMDQVNLELANLKGAILKNALVREAYVSGATRLTDIEIEGSDWSGTFLRKDQQQYLCKRASGVNPITKISTKESLMCPE